MKRQAPALTSLGTLVCGAFDFHNALEAAEAEAAKANPDAEAEAAKANPDAEAAKARCTEATVNKSVWMNACKRRRKEVSNKKQRLISPPLAASISKKKVKQKHNTAKNAKHSKLKN